MKKIPRSQKNVRMMACVVPAAALMLGVSHAATVGINFQANYCGSPSLSGYIVTTQAFGINPGSWQNLMQMDTGYGSCSGPLFTNLAQVIDTTTSTDGLNPLPNGSLSISWGAPMANVSGFSGGYPGNTGEFQVYHGFLRDGVNFGPGSSGGNNNQPGYNIDITGLKTVFTNHPFVIQLINSSDSMKDFTNAFVIDATHSTTQSVVYPKPYLESPQGGAPWVRGYGGGLSTVTPIAIDADHVKIIGNRAAHGGDKTVGNDYNDASTIAGFVVTDKPVVTMSPRPVLASGGQNITLSAYAIGVPPLSYQWRQGGLPISGQTTASNNIASATAASAGDYDLVVTNLYGSTTSKVSTVTMDRISVTPGNNFVVDSNPTGAEHDGYNFGATWLASNADSAGTNRAGVMQFNSAVTNQITVPAASSFNAPTGAIAFWFRSAAAPSSPAIVFDRRDGVATAEGSGLVIIQTTDGELEFQVGNGSIVDTTTSISVSDNKWHHVAFVYKQSIGDAVVYVDGVQTSQQTGNGSWSWPSAREIELGLSHDPFWLPFNGILDDFRLYSRALTGAEVASIHTSDALVDTSTLILRLNFDGAPQSGLTLSWQMPGVVLQSAGSINGPFTDVTGATSPYAAAAQATQKYYRYRNPVTSVVSNPFLM